MASYQLLALALFSTMLVSCQSGPAGQIALAAARASNVPRTIRASFRNPEIGVARGFGKRSQTLSNDVPWSYRKDDAKWLDEIEQQDRDPVQQLLKETSQEGIPIDWLAIEMSSNPYLARAILKRLIDSNKDGYLSSVELMPAILASEANDSF